MVPKLLVTSDGIPYYPVGTITSLEGCGRFVIQGYVSKKLAIKPLPLCRLLEPGSGLAMIPTVENCYPLFTEEGDRTTYNSSKDWHRQNIPIGFTSTKWVDHIYNKLIKE
jgi:hypothetical protein